MTPSFVLASTSPRRRQLLALTALAFKVQPADIDETPLRGETPHTYVLRLAQSKARTVEKNLEQPGVVIAADTIVCDGDQLLGKPHTPDHARTMLQALRGRCHQVITAVALLRSTDQHMQTDLCTSTVCMRDYNEKEMEAYVASGDPLDKAGAYAIQNTAFHPVTGFEGCYASVMGLPLCHLSRSLKNLQISIAADVPQNCQQNLGYTCPIFQAVLQGQTVG